MNHFIYFCSLFSLLLLFNGCAPKKTIDGIKNDQRELLRRVSQRATIAEIRAEDKVRTGEMDSTIFVTVKSVTSEIKQEVRTAELQIEKARMNTVSQVEAVIFEQNKTVRCLISDLSALEDYLNRKIISEFQSTDFFPSGDYSITGGEIAQVKRKLSPATDELVDFALKYAKSKISLTITISGYADEQPIANGTNLYNKLSTALGEQSPTRESLNRQLSQFRADAIGEVVEQMLQEKKTASPDLADIRTEVFKQGRGEEVPPRVLEPKRNDPRRRIVTLQWAIIPQRSGERTCQDPPAVPVDGKTRPNS